MLQPKRTCTRDLFELNGIWDFTREKIGVPYPDGFVAEKKVAVPGSFNDLYAEEEFRTWLRGVWYQTAFALPHSLRGRRLVLRFGAVNYTSEVYFNGRHLGGHETGYTPFEFDITSLVAWDGPNRLHVRIENLLTPETVPQGNLTAKAESGQITGQYPNTGFDFFPYAGIHRPVVVYSNSAEAWLERVRVRTTVHGADAVAAIDGDCAGRCARVQVALEETGAGAEAACGAGGFSVSLPIPQAKLWDEGQPNLYHARVRLLGAVYDEAALAPWFRAAEVFVYPGSIGLSIHHAFGYGLPVVTHGDARQQMPEFAALKPGVNGEVFPRGDAGALATVLRGLCESPARRAALAQAARETVATGWNIDDMVSRFTAALRVAARR